MTEVTENGTREVSDPPTPDTLWFVVYTIRDILTGRRYRKLHRIPFDSEREAQEYHAEWGHFYTDSGFIIENVDFVKFAEVPF